MSEAMLQVGVGQADITPPVGITHANWGATSHDRAIGVDFPFRATVLWLSDGEESILICDLDRGLVATAEASVLREAIGEVVEIPASHVRVSFTHTHAGPLISHGEGRRSGPGTELVPVYKQAVRDQLVGAARVARATAQQATHRSGYVQSHIGVSRRRVEGDRVVVGEEPDGFSDPTVLVTRFSDRDGEPIAGIIGYGAHPTTLGHTNQFLSPDYPGFARDEMQKLTGATVLFLQGSAGDQMSRGGFTDDRRVARRLGRQLAYTAAGLYMELGEPGRRRPLVEIVESGAPIAILGDVAPEPTSARVGCLSEEIELSIREHPQVKEAAAQVEEDLARLEEARGDGGRSLPAAMMRAKRSETALFFAKWLDGEHKARIEMQIMTVGELALVGVPGEPFARLGSELRDRSPFHYTQLSGYSNGWQGYLPDPGEFARGGYEIEIASVFGETAGTELVDAAAASLSALHADSG